MTDTTNGAVSLKPDLGRFGVWTGGPVTPEEALEIEKLGYGAVWVGASPAADLSFVEPILEKTDTLQVATGIVNIWSAPGRRGRRVLSPHRKGLSREGFCSGSGSAIPSTPRST